MVMAVSAANASSAGNASAAADAISNERRVVCMKVSLPNLSDPTAVPRAVTNPIPLWINAGFASRIQRRQIGGDIHPVFVRHVGDFRFHRIECRTAARAVLDIIELAHKG